MCKTSPSHLRWIIQNRDHGVCALCGLNTIDLAAAISWVNGHCRKQSYSHSFGGEANKPTTARQWSNDEWREFKNAIGVGDRWPGDLWDADHIIPVIEGGGECGIDNFRTLCIPCHKKETAALRRRMAQRRIENKRVPLFDEAC